MTTGGEEQPQLEIGVTPVASQGSARGRVAVLVLISVIAGAIGIATLWRSGPGGSGSSPNPAAGPGQSRQPSPNVARSSAATQRGGGSPAGRVEEHLPDVPVASLRGAPTPAFLRRDGDDLELLRWLPGDDHLRPVATMPGVFRGIAEGAAVVESSAPGGGFAFVRTITGSAAGGPDRAVIATAGGIVWIRADVTGRGGILWSSDGSRAVVPIKPGRWALIGLKDPKPVVRTLDVGEAIPPGPRPDLPLVAQPVGFSANGRWIYGESTANVDGTIRTSFRVAWSGGKANSIDRFPTTGADRLVAERVEPGTGRTTDLGGPGYAPPTTMVARTGDGEVVYRLDFPAILGSAWVGDGRLALMVSNTVNSPRSVRVLAISSDGATATAVIDAGPISGAGLLEARDGFALLAFSTEYPREEALILMIRMSDEAKASLRLGRDDVTGLQLGGWLD